MQIRAEAARSPTVGTATQASGILFQVGDQGLIEGVASQNRLPANAGWTRCSKRFEVAYRVTNFRDRIGRCEPIDDEPTSILFLFEHT